MGRRRLATLLALTADETELLIARCRPRLGRRAYAMRLVALLLVTTPVVRRVIPAELRRRAIRPFVYDLLSGPSENLLYAQVRPSPHSAVAND